jgi:hypothetical protein
MKGATMMAKMAASVVRLRIAILRHLGHCLHFTAASILPHRGLGVFGFDDDAAHLRS